MSDKVTAAEMVNRLRRHYIKPGPMPGGIFLPECGLNGATGNRVDAVYIGFTSTSGRHLVGHEIKVSRSDWLHELDQPGKADMWADQCHAWYAVAPSTDIIKPEELPAGWGLMVINPKSKTRLDVKVKAAVHAVRHPSWQIVRSIMARLDTLQTAELSAIRRDALEEARKDVAAQVKKRIEDAGEYSPGGRAIRTLNAFKDAFGVDLDQWLNRPDIVSAERLRDAIDLLAADRALSERYDGLDNSIKGIETLLERLTRLQDSITAYDKAAS